MEHSKLIQIDSLIADENFRKAVKSLALNEPIPDSLINSYNHVAMEDLELARRLIQTPAEALSTDYSNKAKIWERIEEASIRFDKLENPSGSKLTVYKDSINWRRFLKYAAVLVGLSFLVTWNVLESGLLNDRLEISSEMVAKINPSGQKSRITLPDGSIAHLNAESELLYDRNFVGDQRTVYLKRGEAYFEVSRNKEKPFVVIIDNISVTALGTEFNVNTFNEDLEVALVEGSVLVNNASNNDHLIMKPSEVLKFHPKSNRMNISSNNAKELADWRDQVIYFNNTPLGEAVKTLSRWYAVRISLEKDAPSGLTVSGKFSNSSLELVLTNLSYSLDFEFTMEDKDISIKFKE